jgi:cytochrome c553
MRNMKLLSIITATLLLTACGDDAKTETKVVTPPAVVPTKVEAPKVVAPVEAKVEEVVAPVVAKVEEVVAPVVAKVEEVVAPVEAKVEEVVAPVEAKVEEVVAPKVISSTEAGKAIFTKCLSCHGADGKTSALGKSAVIAGQLSTDLEKSLMEYKAGTRNVAGMGMLMKGQVGTMSDEDIKAVAEYISTL